MSLQILRALSNNFLLQIPSGITRARDEEEYVPRTYKGIVIEDKPQEMVRTFHPFALYNSANGCCNFPNKQHFNHFEDEEGESNVAFKKRKLNTETSLVEDGDDKEAVKPLFKPPKAKNYRKK